MDIVSQLLIGLEQLKQPLENLDKDQFLASLPSVQVKDYDVSRSLPFKVSALYFLSHHREGLLYIGKSVNLRSRWLVNMFSEHDCHEPSLQLGNVLLSWCEMPAVLLTVSEEILIQLWSPKWNGHTGKSNVKRALDFPDFNDPNRFKDLWK